MKVAPLGLARPVVVWRIGIAVALALLSSSESRRHDVGGTEGKRSWKIGAPQPQRDAGADPGATAANSSTEVDGRQPHLSITYGRSTIAPPGAAPEILSLLPRPCTALPPLSDLLFDVANPAVRGDLPLVIAPAPRPRDDKVG